MVRGFISTAKTTPQDKLISRHIRTASVIFTTLDNDWGSVFSHIGDNHIQVIVCKAGKEVLRQVFTR